MIIIGVIARRIADTFDVTRNYPGKDGRMHFEGSVPALGPKGAEMRTKIMTAAEMPARRAAVHDIKAMERGVIFRKYYVHGSIAGPKELRPTPKRRRRS